MKYRTPRAPAQRLISSASYRNWLRAELGLSFATLAVLVSIATVRPDHRGRRTVYRRTLAVWHRMHWRSVSRHTAALVRAGVLVKHPPAKRRSAKTEGGWESLSAQAYTLTLPVPVDNPTPDHTHKGDSPDTLRPSVGDTRSDHTDSDGSCEHDEPRGPRYCALCRRRRPPD